jgi:general stress protein 26
MENKPQLEVAVQLMNNAQFCFVVTCQLDSPNAKLVIPTTPAVSGDSIIVYYPSNTGCGQVKYFENHPNVLLAYADKENRGYVTVHGTTEVIKDHNEKKKIWKEEWNTYCQPNHDDCVVIRVSSQKIEVMSEGHRVGDIENTKNWKPDVIITSAPQKSVHT